MRHLLITSALALAIAGPALAETKSATPGNAAASAAGIYMTRQNGTDLYGSDVIGASVHAIRGEEREDIGEVNDLLVSRSGNVKAVLVDVGGFLGVGEKTVAIEMDGVTIERTDDDTPVIVVEASRQSLEAAPTFEKSAPESWTDAGRFDTELSEAPEISRDGYETVALDRLTVDDLYDAWVYDANDEQIGEISEILVNANGAIEGAVIDVGGFLGLGEHSVAVPFDKITILRDAEDATPRLHVDVTREGLEKMREFEG